MNAFTRPLPRTFVTDHPEDQLHLGIRTACSAAFVASLLVAVAVWPASHPATVLSWLGALWSLLAFRTWTVSRHFQIRGTAAARARSTCKLALGSAATGLLWGAAAFLFVDAPNDHRLPLICVVLCGLTTVTHPLHAPVLPVAAAYLSTVLGPLALRLVLFGDTSSLILAGAVALYLAGMLLSARNRSRLIQRAREMGLQNEQIEAQQRERDRVRLRLFEGLLGTEPLPDLLDRVARYAEATRPHLMCGILLLDADGRRLVAGAAPSLPAAYSAAIDGLEVGDGAGSCCSAAWLGGPVIAADVQTHPCWEDYRGLAAQFGLRSCWSFPIQDGAGRVLGVFALYGRSTGLPDGADLAVIREACHLATVAIAHRTAAEQLMAREREFRTLVENSPDTIARYDADCRRIYANPKLVFTAGVSAAELLGKTPKEFPGGESAELYHVKIQEALATGRKVEFELHWADSFGAEHHTHVRLEPEHDTEGQVTHVLAVGRDVTRLVDYQRKLRELAYKDALTGLPNRSLLRSSMQESFKDAIRAGLPATLIVLGLDRFKSINDTFGRQAGDELLRATSERLNGCLDYSALVARLEGDEFGIFFPSLPSDSSDTAIAAILAAFEAPFAASSMEVRLTASVGMASCPEHGHDADELLRCAALALHHAKLDGRGRTRRYTPEFTSAAQERLALEAEMRKGIASGAFVLYYQPKIALDSGRIVGAEALLRWRHPERGLLTPDRFIGLAEETGLIIELGEWVLTAACRTARQWNEHGDRSCRIAVNLSARQFAGGRLADTVRQILATTGCRPQWLELEITESLLLDDLPEIHATLDALAGLGVTLAIDDFGTGYSALGYLTRFPIDTLKIDRSFVSGVVVDRESAALVKAIASMAHSLQLNVVAEGVEALNQADFLREIGCQLAQGFLYGRPMPAEVFPSLLQPSPAGAA